MLCGEKPVSARTEETRMSFQAYLSDASDTLWLDGKATKPQS